MLLTKALETWLWLWSLPRKESLSNLGTCLGYKTSDYPRECPSSVWLCKTELKWTGHGVGKEQLGKRSTELEENIETNSGWILGNVNTSELDNQRRYRDIWRTKLFLGPSVVTEEAQLTLEFILRQSLSSLGNKLPWVVPYRSENSSSQFYFSFFQWNESGLLWTENKTVQQLCDNWCFHLILVYGL